MRTTIIMISALTLLLSMVTGCSSLNNALKDINATPSEKIETAAMAAEPKTIEGPLNFNYPVRETLDVSITFENHKAYDAVQLGLSLLDQSKEMGDVPSIEDPDFFPDYFSLVNIDISDGLLLITEEEAANFARETYLEYQKKIVPAGYLRSMRKHRIVQEILSSRPVIRK